MAENWANEEWQFIKQAIVAPYSIGRRMVEGEGFVRAVALTIDRDEFVKDLRARQTAKLSP